MPHKLLPALHSLLGPEKKALHHHRNDLFQSWLVVLEMSNEASFVCV